MKPLSPNTPNPQNEMPLEEVYTVEEVAETLKFNVRTVQGWIKKGKLKATKIGSDYRITETAVKEFLKEHEV